MAIRKPSVSVEEAKRLARLLPDAEDRQAKPNDAIPAPEPETPTVLERDTIVEPAPFIAKPDEPPSSASIEPASRSVASSPVQRPGQAILPAQAFTGVVFPEVELEEPKSQVFLSAPLPARGVSPSFDALSKQYPATKALQMILRRALDAYEARLEDGSYKALQGEYQLDAKGRPAIIQTSRMMPDRLIEIARGHFDPLGFESTRAFGRKLACAALACFFATEGVRK